MSTKIVIAATAALLTAAGSASLAAPAPITDEQMDTVTAGVDIFSSVGAVSSSVSGTPAAGTTISQSGSSVGSATTPDQTPSTPSTPPAPPPPAPPSIPHATPPGFGGLVNVVN